MDDDDDTPPPLSSLPDQVQALGISTTGSQQGSGAEQLPVASTTYVGKASAAAAVAVEPKKLKKGFFDAKPKAKAQPKPASGQQQGSTGAQDAMPVLIGRKEGIGRGGPSIPDFLRVEPDEQAKRLEEVKGKLVSALQPTPDMMSKLATNPELMAGFDDPEVMAAVNEISKDPSKSNKYKDNAKVGAFYKAMALFAGNQLEKIENKPL